MLRNIHNSLEFSAQSYDLAHPSSSALPTCLMQFFAKAAHDNVCWAHLSPLNFNFILELHLLLPKRPLRGTDTFQQVPDYPGSELLKDPTPFFPSFPSPCCNLMVPSLSAFPSFLSFHFFLRSISCFFPNLSFCLVNLREFEELTQISKGSEGHQNNNYMGLHILEMWDLLSMFVLSVCSILAGQLCFLSEPPQFQLYHPAFITPS